MAVPILFFYVLGLILFILGFEDIEGMKKTVYFGLSFFVGMMGYYLSYLDVDYLSASYFPLVLSIFSLIMLLWTVWGMIPVNKSWGDQAEDEAT